MASVTASWKRALVVAARVRTTFSANSIGQSSTTGVRT